MRRISFAFAFVFIICFSVYGGEFPVFKLPSSLNYNLFNYSYTVPTLANEKEKNQIKSVSKELNMNIYGIFISDGKRVVLINDRILKKGDKIDGYLIKKITNNEVIFAKGNSVVTERLNMPGSNKVIFDNNTIKSN